MVIRTPLGQHLQRAAITATVRRASPVGRSLRALASTLPFGTPSAVPVRDAVMCAQDASAARGDLHASTAGTPFAGQSTARDASAPDTPGGQPVEEEEEEEELQAAPAGPRRR